MGKEILELITNKQIKTPEEEKLIEEYLAKHPEVSYMLVNEDEDPGLRKMLGPSQAPTAHPCFIGMIDGKVVGIQTGKVSESDIDNLLK